jgi:hypothetical protein
MFDRGQRQVDVVAEPGVSAQTASRWYQAWSAGGRGVWSLVRLERRQSRDRRERRTRRCRAVRLRRRSRRDQGSPPSQGWSSPCGPLYGWHVPVVVAVLISGGGGRPTRGSASVVSTTNRSAGESWSGSAGGGLIRGLLEHRNRTGNLCANPEEQVQEPLSGAHLTADRAAVGAPERGEHKASRVERDGGGQVIDRAGGEGDADGVRVGVRGLHGVLPQHVHERRQRSDPVDLMMWIPQLPSEFRRGSTSAQSAPVRPSCAPLW